MPLPEIYFHTVPNTLDLSHTVPYILPYGIKFVNHEGRVRDASEHRGTAGGARCHAGADE